MEQPFNIQFSYPLEDSGLLIHLEAMAELHHSDPYYKIYFFQRITHPRLNTRDQQNSVLEPVEIKLVMRERSLLWVHRDSGKESSLSVAIGKAITDVTGSPEISSM